jgi:preprotein translocase subunit SecB
MPHPAQINDGPLPVESPTAAPHDLGLLEQVQDIVLRTRLLDIRLTHWSGDVQFTVQNEAKQLRIDPGTPEYRISDDSISCRFRHTIELLDDDQNVCATVESHHIANFALAPGPDISEDAVSTWVDQNVFFMVYPYLREAVQTMTTRLSLDPVVLGTLLRDGGRPSGVSILTSGT